MEKEQKIQIKEVEFLRTYPLESEKSAWLDLSSLPDELEVNFEELWKLHPEEFAIVDVFGPKKTPRWQQSYGKPYYYSKRLHESLPVPPILIPILNWVNSIEKYKTQFPFNQILVNWYQDGTHYIGPHSDDETQLVRNSPILSISLGQTRTFRLRDKKDVKTIIEDYELEDRGIVVMGGKFQKVFKHEIVKTKIKGVGRRINITFRKFEEDEDEKVDEKKED